MKLSGTILLVAGLCLTGCDGKKEAAPAKSSTSGGNPLTAPADYLGAVSKAKQSADKTLVSAGLTQAIQQFYAQEGRFPKDLKELVSPNYLSALPAPPAGMKFNYNPTTGDLKLAPNQVKLAPK